MSDRKEIQALHAAISRRDWHAVEVAANVIRDQEARRDVPEPRLDGLPINCQHITVRVPDDHDHSQPIPLRIRVDNENPNCFATSDGKRIFYERQWAEKSMLMDTEEYQERSRRRMLAGRLTKAEIVENYAGWVTCSGDEDDYFDSIDALIEHYTDRIANDKSDDNEPTEEEIKQSLPAWVYCTTEDAFIFDLEGALDCYLADNHHEDARDLIKDYDWLREFWKFWSSKQSGVFSYCIDYSRIVVIDRERFDAEMEQAKAIVAEVAT
ncbi:hypothetical protein CES85_1678 [Ochrobactrum quorumnocens]|uniref:Uncharacterized protein n=1 Tax=Ochrobactrum quorumnocens TaxID=271865 RepID=A0A248UIK0_9HYPH|nr:hypothetical protein [[Ochrobactrum] quorumnocens]ASV86663.1 hypothetical protein CES85_1678 [[Ochrobactrum] quorumnocens]